EVMVVRDLVDEDVVHEAPVFVEQARVVRLAGLEFLDGVGGDEVSEPGRFRAADLDSAHVADVEQRSCLPDGVELANHSRVLDWHVPAREIHHLGAEGAMGRIQGCTAKRGRCQHESPRLTAPKTGCQTGIVSGGGARVYAPSAIAGFTAAALKNRGA